jgi:hypothetical protein
MDRILGLLFALLAILGSVLAEDTRLRTWRSFIGFDSPYLVPLPAGEPGPAVSRRVVLIVVRGLNAEEAATMPALTALRKRGAHATLTLDAPTYATTTWLTMMSGAGPEIHGSLSDDAARAPALDTLFERVSGAGGVGALLAVDPIVRHFTPGPQLNDVFDESNRSEHDAGVVAAIAQSLRLPNAPERFIVAELSMLDAPRSPADEPARAMALAATDIRIESIAGSIDLNNDTLIVTSDRGRAPDGREGGDEPAIASVPLILVGAGVTRDAQTLGRGVDVAPTVAMLLGIPIPMYSEGVPLWDLIRSRAMLVAARQLTAFYESWAETVGQDRFAAELLRRYEADIVAGDRARFEVWHAALMQSVADARGAAQFREQTARLPTVIAIAVVLIVAVAFILDQNAQPPLIGSLVFIGLLIVDAIIVYGIRPTLSLFEQNGNSSVLSLLARDTSMLYIVAAAITTFAATFICETYEEALLATMGMFIVAITGAAAFALFFHFQWGDEFGLLLPEHTQFIWSQFALRIIAAMNITIVEGWPPIPAPLVALAPSFLTWQLFGGRIIRA